MTTIETDPKRAEWLEARGATLGASDVPAILGMNPYRSRLQVWVEKWNHKRGLPRVDDGMTEDQEWGLLLEDVIAQKYGAVTGRQVRRNRSYQVLRHPSLPLSCTRDALVYDPEKGRGPLEIKTSGKPSTFWDAEGPTPAWQVQLQVQILLSQNEWGSFAALFFGGGRNFRWVDIGKHQEFIDEVLLPEVEAFWESIEKEEPPEPSDGSSATKKALLEIWPEPGEQEHPIILPGEAINYDLRLQDLDEEIKRLSDEREELRRKLEYHIGDHEAGLLPDSTARYTWKVQKRDSYIVAASQTRVLRRKALKGIE